jgi:glycine betaine transporter
MLRSKLESLLSGSNLLFFISVLVAVAVAVWGIVAPDGLGNAASGATSIVFSAVGWFFLGAVTLFLLVCIGLAVSRYGQIKLGKDDDEPEFSVTSWLAMLFAAGMGVGLVFWGVAEPIFHFAMPPVLEGGTPEAARGAMVLTCFHWGLHAWAVYAMAALVVAYFGFRKGQPQLPGAPIRAVFRQPWAGPVAWGADFIGTVAVALGVSGSIGMGVLQIQSGLHVTLGVSESSIAVALAIVAVLVVTYMISASTGLNKGIRILSNVNMSIAIVLMLFLLFAGPTAYLLKIFFTSAGDYASSIVGLSFRLFPYRDMDQWLSSWTLTYFIFWVAWAPFVGVFIARISRGRTIREFVVGVLLVPSVFSVLWFAIFGGTAIHEELHGMGGISQMAVEDVTRTLFFLFDRLPLSGLLSMTAVLLVFIFLVTSADSATFVLGMLTSGGSLNPPTKKKILWGVLIGALSTALMLTRNIDPLRAVITAGAVPFVFVMLLQTTALLKALKAEDLHGIAAGKRPDAGEVDS